MIEKSKAKKKGQKKYCMGVWIAMKLVDEIDDLVDSGEFNSRSDFGRIAVVEKLRRERAIPIPVVVRKGPPELDD